MKRLPWVVLLLMVLFGAAWWMFLISPRDAEIDRLERELDAAFDAEDLLRAQITSLQSVRDNEVQFLIAVGQLESLIPEQPRLDELIEQIHRLALDTGVVLSSMTPVPPAPSTADAELREIVVAVRIEGEFFQVLGFLFGLNDLERLVRVDAVAVNSLQDPLGRTQLVVALQVRAFTLADVIPEVLEPLPPTDVDDGDGADDGTQEEEA